jgi:hypothetical protein
MSAKKTGHFYRDFAEVFGTVLGEAVESEMHFAIWAGNHPCTGAEILCIIFSRYASE